jgi:hypothetical protein
MRKPRLTIIMATYRRTTISIEQSAALIGLMLRSVAARGAPHFLEPMTAAVRLPDLAPRLSAQIWRPWTRRP